MVMIENSISIPMVRIQPQAQNCIFIVHSQKQGGNRETERKEGREMQRKKEISKEKIKEESFGYQPLSTSQPPICPLLHLVLPDDPPLILSDDQGVFCKAGWKNSKCSQTHYS